MDARKIGVATTPDLYRLLFEANPEPMWVFEPQTLAFLDANAAAQAHYGYSLPELLGIKVTDLHLPGEQDTVREAVARTLAAPADAGMIGIGHHRLRRKDGRVLDAEMSWACLATSTGLGILALARDVTEQRFAEEALWASEAQVRAILETSLHAIVLMDTRGMVLSWNPRAEVVFGWTRAEAVGKRMADLIVPPSYREAYERGLERFRETHEGPILNRRVEFEALRRDGSRFPVEIRVSALHEHDGYAFCAFVEDITERKLAQDRVAQAAERFEKAFRASPAAMSITTLREGRYVDVNEAFQRLTRYRREDIVGRTSFELNLWKDAGQRNGLLEPLLAKGSVRRMPLRFRTADGERREIRISAELITVDGERCLLALHEPEIEG